MGIILDIVLLAIFALSVFVGYKKGLIGVVFNLCAFLVSLVLTWILFTPVSNMIIKNTQIDDNIKNVIIEKRHSAPLPPKIKLYDGSRF